MFCQRIQKLNKTGSTEIFLDLKVDAVGPGGNSSMGIASNDMYDSVTLAGYPQLKNLPDSLSKMNVYTVIRNLTQFYYQNYQKGLYSKDFFLETSRKRNWLLDDTCKLSNKMVRCYFSFVVGYDRSGNPKYVIDTNGNDDFADEELFTLSESDPSSSVNINSKSVVMEYYDGQYIKQEKDLCSLTLARSNAKGTKEKIQVVFSFPQFIYGRISYEGENYYVCADLNTSAFNNSIYILPEVPNFQKLSDDYIVKPNQIATFGKANFKYEPISQNLDRIRLTSGFSDLDKTIYNAKPKVQAVVRPLVLEQVGMLAPEIEGINVQDGAILSLNTLRGKYVFLDFWATWCGPCVRELPNIRKVYDTFSSDQFVVMGICDDDYNGKIKTFLKDNQVIWPTIVKRASTTKTKGYNIASLPTSYLIGPDGKIVTSNLRGDALFMYLENLKVKKK